MATSVWGVNPCSGLLLKGLQLISGINHGTSHNPPAAVLWNTLAGITQSRGCSSEANPTEGSACSNPPASFHLSVPADAATVAKDGDEAASPSSCRGAAGPGPAGSHPPAPSTAPLPAPAAGLVPTRAPQGGGCAPVRRTALQKKGPSPSPAARAGPWPEQEAAGGGQGRSPMALC